MPERSTSEKKATKDLLDRYGRTYAEEAGIALADRPGPLYQLLVLTTLLSARINASVAIAAARALFQAGYRTPGAMLDASWQDRVDALGRGHYRRYDERTATMLGDAAQYCLDRWHGDLRQLHREAGADHGAAAPTALRKLLMEFKGIGPTGADIFLREVQDVWTDIRPYFDAKVAAGARKVHLPTSPERLAGLTDPAQTARMASALVRVALDGRPANDGRSANEGRSANDGRAANKRHRTS